MLVIRLSRVGKKKEPVYRIAVMQKHQDPWAKTTEVLGHYNPRKQPKELVINSERLNYWIKEGTQCSDTVWNLLIEHKIIEGEKRSVTHLSKRRVDEMADTKVKEVAVKAKADANRKAAEEANIEFERKTAEDAKAKIEAEKVEAEAEKIKAEAETPKVEAEAPVEVAVETPKELEVEPAVETETPSES